MCVQEARNQREFPSQPDKQTIFSTATPVDDGQDTYITVRRSLIKVGICDDMHKDVHTSDASTV